eukprot:SM000061S19275  [mRNA]  locus=s61:534349:535475:+ [translate_table: standard]
MDQGLTALQVHSAAATASAGIWEASFLGDGALLVEWCLAPYRTLPEALCELRPTVILTQLQLGRGAVTRSQVEAALASLLGYAPRLVHMDPANLAGVWADVRAVAAALLPNGDEVGCAEVARLQARMAVAAGLARGRPVTSKVLLVQWADPPLLAGAWAPELLALSGVDSVDSPLAAAAAPTWASLAAACLDAAAPPLLIFALCGLDLEASLAEARRVIAAGHLSGFKPAARVAVMDAARLLTRPGPSLVEALEVLVEVLHPEAQPFNHLGRLWLPLDLHTTA